MHFRASFLVIAVVLGLVATADSYTFELDWTMSPPSAQTVIGYVTWNQEKLITLTNVPFAATVHHESVNVTFNEGPNKLGFYFIGLASNLLIDNVKLTKNSKSINFILNGDFEMCSFEHQLFHVYKNKIPGWSAPKIMIGKSTQGSNQLVLNSQFRSLTQTISFGKVSKYEFIDSINSAIQNQAKSIIAANLQSITVNSVGNGRNIWNTPAHGDSSSIANNYPQLLKIYSSVLNSTTP